MKNKVRVLKEMPFAKVGEKFECANEKWNNKPSHSDIIQFNSNNTVTMNIEDMVKDGWLEWIEEDKSLEKKIEIPLIGSQLTLLVIREIAQIANDHFLEVFDKTTRGNWSSSIFNDLRKALEDA